ncbi:hypothetical protein DFP73DRAFT_476901 [Morchella snyderi]|nr:hypothetical protein DFP73DRAFT_476901 [Morchella snyderi]
MMSIRAVFVVIALFVHGYIRSSTPRLYLLVLLMIFPVLIGLTSPSFEVSPMFPKQFLYPILTAVAIVLLVSVLVFPEFGSTHLGLSTIQTLQSTIKVQRSASALFVAYAESSAGGGDVDVDKHLRELTASKADLRRQVAACKAVLTECSFELAFSVLAPWELRPIASRAIKRLVANTVSLVGACESEYALLGRPQGAAADTEQKEKDEIDKLRPKREIESGDERLLRYLLRRVEQPLNGLQAVIDRSIDIVNTCVAYTYDVPALPSHKQDGTARRPHGVLLAELDIYIDTLSSAITRFGQLTTDALEGAAVLTEPVADAEGDVDVMPRDEVFLISSFMLNLRQAASHTLDMLVCSRGLVEKRMERRERRRLWFPKIRFRKWLFSGREEADRMPSVARAAFAVDGADAEEESDYSSSRETLTRERRRRARKAKKAREKLADWLEWVAASDDVLYAFKLTLGVTICAWPAFVGSWAEWFYLNRGVWVALIFILVFENAVGSTIWIFALRAVGTVIGSTWGYAAYKARGGNAVVIAVMIMIGSIPSYYVQLGTKYTKAGMVCTISMCVVAVSTHLQTVPGSSEENFYKRTVTMLIGGCVATLVQMIILPAKARVRLKESLASAIVQINKMESCIAYGVDEVRNITSSPRVFKKFERARKKAETALASAETFLTYTRQEPRLKGSFEMQEVVYKEIIFVLRQIVDRMENLVQMRKAYGSAILEQYNARVYNYRRNVAASITLMLFACHEALTTKLPLPQFLPSARIAHLRMVVRVRQLLMEEEDEQSHEGAHPASLATRRALRLKFLSWNAATAALEECIEYVEELVDLLKMLVGANEFRSGLLNRPTYHDYVQRIRQVRTGGPGKGEEDGRTVATGNSLGRLTSRIMGGGGAEDQWEAEDIPNPLQRIQSRKAAGAKLGKVKSDVVVGGGSGGGGRRGSLKEE